MGFEEAGGIENVKSGRRGSDFETPRYDDFTPDPDGLHVVVVVVFRMRWMEIIRRWAPLYNGLAADILESNRKVIVSRMVYLFEYVQPFVSSRSNHVLFD
jgi:hypothetical protein